MPNAATLSRAVETRDEVLGDGGVRASSVSSIASAAPSSSQSQSRARRAFVSVSRVPNVLDATMNSVVVRVEALAVFSAMSVGSMFETNRTSMPSCTYGLQRLVRHDRARGPSRRCRCSPRSRPARRSRRSTRRSGPCPRTRRSWSARPARRRRCPGRRRRARACAPAGRRSAVCRTARSSVTLMWSPRNSPRGDR